MLIGAERHGESVIEEPSKFGGLFGCFPVFWGILRNICAQLCPILCGPMDYSLPDSSVHGIFQGRILERVAISSSWGSPWPRVGTHISCVSRISRQVLLPLDHLNGAELYGVHNWITITNWWTFWMFPSIFNLQFQGTEWETQEDAHGSLKLDEITVWVKAGQTQSIWSYLEVLTERRRFSQSGSREDRGELRRLL